MNQSKKQIQALPNKTSSRFLNKARQHWEPLSSLFKILFFLIAFSFIPTFSLAADNPTHVINGTRYTANEIHEGILKFESENDQNVPYLEITENGRTRKFELVVNRNNLDYMDKIKALPKDEPYVFFGGRTGGTIIVESFRRGRLNDNASLQPVSPLNHYALSGLLAGDYLFQLEKSTRSVLIFKCKENGVPFALAIVCNSK